jgi:hypothetical protein
MTLKDENGAERIFFLSLPDRPEALEILPHVGKLERLTTLTIAFRKLTDEHLEMLPALPGLLEFGMISNQVTDKGLQHLAGMTELRRLRIFGIKGIRGAGFAYLKESTKLEFLYAHGSGLEDSAIPHIVKNFRKLRRFDFDKTGVTADGLLQLAELPWLTTLAPPEDIAGPRDAPNHKERLHDLLSRYVKLYKESKQRARQAGEDVPPDHVGPFGLVE